MFAQLVTNFKKGRKQKFQRDVVAEQVKKMLQESDQKLILMVRE